MNGIERSITDFLDKGISMFIYYIKDLLHNPYVIIIIISIVVIGLTIEGIRNI